jgi:hypothetical protein
MIDIARKIIGGITTMNKLDRMRQAQKKITGSDSTGVPSASDRGTIHAISVGNEHLSATEYLDRLDADQLRNRLHQRNSVHGVAS